MRTAFLLLAVLLASAPAAAQQGSGSPAAQPSSGAAAAATAPAAPQDDPDLPVSLDKIREGLAKPAPSFTFNFNVPSTFRTQVREQSRLDIPRPNNFDWGPGPVPPGGLYGYEADRVMRSAANLPLMQPYAAFNGGELLTLSLEALAERYLGGRALSAVSAAERARATAAARTEVLHAIAGWCTAQPDKGASQPICQGSQQTK
jgi:hypothetical protein